MNRRIQTFNVSPTNPHTETVIEAVSRVIRDLDRLSGMQSPQWETLTIELITEDYADFRGLAEGGPLKRVTYLGSVEV